MNFVFCMKPWDRGVERQCNVIQKKHFLNKKKDEDCSMSVLLVRAFLLILNFIEIMQFYNNTNMTTWPNTRTPVRIF